MKKVLFVVLLIGAFLFGCATQEAKTEVKDYLEYVGETRVNSNIKVYTYKNPNNGDILYVGHFGGYGGVSVEVSKEMK